MKDLDHLRYFLGLEVAYAQRGYLVSQQKCTSDILSRACLNDTWTAATPIELHHRLSISDGKLLLGYPVRSPTMPRTPSDSCSSGSADFPNSWWAPWVYLSHGSTQQTGYLSSCSRASRSLQYPPFNIRLSELSCAPNSPLIQHYSRLLFTAWPG